MKVLIATGIYPPDIGGPATILEALANSLKEKGFNIQIITYSSVKEHSGDTDEIFRIVKSKFFSRWQYLWQMFKLSRQADLVYVTDTYSVGYFAYLIKKITGKKYIVRFAGDGAWEMAVARGWTQDYIIDFQDKVYNSKIARLKKRRQKILVSANKVIAVSHFMAMVAQKIGVDKNKIKIIYNSIDFIKDNTVDLDKVEQIKKQYGQNAKLIVSACRLTSWKGIDGIIKSLPNIRQKIGDVNFLILGDGPEMENLKNLADKLGLASNVYFLGIIKHSEVINYFKAANLFILNTNYEGLSHTLLEAIKAGAPIITTDVGGNPEVIENNKNGLLISYNNQAELIDAVIKMLSDERLATNLANEATKVLPKFNWDNIISETVKLLKET
ncbi:MAG: glycosyltransferase family 4 protein [bacterium]|nr:glycosyltransferase family 4 protein [bacterium]